MPLGASKSCWGLAKGGNSYLRRPFVQGARAVLQQSAKQSSGLSAWLAQLTSRTHRNVAAVALANKLARMAWGSSLRMNPIGPRCWPLRQQRDWPADDAWLRPGLEIAFAIPTSTGQRLLRVGDFMPGLLANSEMTQRSNPALSKPVNRKMPSKAALL
jgi:hypothetical protein